MHDITFEPGAKLMRTFKDSETGKPVRVDVAATAHQFLFETVELKDGVTLADVFALLELDPLLLQVYRRDFSEDLMAHARKGPLKTAATYGPEELEALELYQVVELDSVAKRLDGGSMLQFHGLGFELREDTDMGGYIQPKGSRVHWGIALTDVRELLHLPLKVNSEVVVTEGCYDAKGYGQELGRLHRESVTLGQVLHGVLWELSFHGGPVEQGAVREDLAALSAKVTEALDREKEGEPSGFITIEDLFEDLDKSGVAALFEQVGDLSVRDITTALRALADDADVAAGLAEQLGDRSAQLVIREPYRTLPALAFRRAIREARSL